jgi:hypothetical protein
MRPAEIFLTYPMELELDPSGIMWVDIYVNRTASPSNGTVDVSVRELFTYRPMEDVKVVAISTMDPDRIAFIGWTDEDGEMELKLRPGEYTIRTEGQDVKAYRPEVTVSVHSDETVQVMLYLPPMELVPGMTTTMKFVEGKEAASRVEVQIAGVGEFESDDDGIATFLIGYRGNHTVTFSREVLSIKDSAGSAVPFNPDGTLPLVPGETYTVSVKGAGGVTERREGRIDDPLSVALLLIAILAFIVGIALGYQFLKRPKNDLEE